MYGDFEKVEDIDQLESDFANFKFSLYVVNPYKGKYFGP